MIFLRNAVLYATLAMSLIMAAPAFADCNTNCYGALSAGMWRDSSGGAHVASGAAWNYGTVGGAQQGALNQCHDSGGLNCSIVGSFSNGGCGYISVGSNDDGVRYGVSRTPSGALAQCSEGGYSCHQPVGGCTSEP